MNDYKRVGEALASGADPAMLCATCPWDRYCIEPPSMTREEIERETAKMKLQDEEIARKNEAEGKSGGMPMGALLGAVMFSGKDTSAAVCPVFAARLRSSSGRVLADAMKSQMQAWNDDVVGVA